jgi:hypothetical protein
MDDHGYLTYVEADRGYAFVGGPHVSTLKESTVNLKQHELLQLIAAGSRDLNQLIESRMHSGRIGEDRTGFASKGLAPDIRERVTRMQQLAAELEP